MEGCENLVCQATPKFFDAIMFRAGLNIISGKFKEIISGRFFLNCH